jgi:arsenite-transporting ATPase
VINKSMAITGTHDPLLRARIRGEKAQIERVKRDCAKRIYGLDFRAVAPTGLEELQRISEER